jgi:glutaminyl-peptide cyclotransferase
MAKKHTKHGQTPIPSTGPGKPSPSLLQLRTTRLLIPPTHSHLAETWSTVFLPPHPKRRLISSSTPVTQLSTIEHLVLLDLLGAANPQVRSYFPDTAWLFDALVDAETRLRTAGILDATELGNSFFHSRSAADHSLGYMGDDHLPFLHRGVSVLHVIAEPFPRVWHTLAVRVLLPHMFSSLIVDDVIGQDDATALDLPTLRAWNLIFRVFFAEYLGLRPDLLKRDEPSPAAHGPPAVRKSDSELVRFFCPLSCGVRCVADSRLSQ